MTSQSFKIRFHNTFTNNKKSKKLSANKTLIIIYLKTETYLYREKICLKLAGISKIKISNFLNKFLLELEFFNLL